MSDSEKSEDSNKNVNLQGATIQNLTIALNDFVQGGLMAKGSSKVDRPTISNYTFELAEKQSQTQQPKRSPPIETSVPDEFQDEKRQYINTISNENETLLNKSLLEHLSLCSVKFRIKHLNQKEITAQDLIDEIENILNKKTPSTESNSHKDLMSELYCYKVSEKLIQEHKQAVDTVIPSIDSVDALQFVFEFLSKETERKIGETPLHHGLSCQRLNDRVFEKIKRYEKTLRDELISEFQHRNAMVDYLRGIQQKFVDSFKASILSKKYQVVNDGCFESFYEAEKARVEKEFLREASFIFDKSLRFEKTKVSLKERLDELLKNMEMYVGEMIKTWNFDESHC